LFEPHKGQSTELRDFYFTTSYTSPTLWSLGIVDIDIKFLVLFLEKSVFFNFSGFQNLVSIEVPYFQGLEGGEL
jgi:hypothetical protein